MIKLKIGRIKLRTDIEEQNKNAIKRRCLDTKNKISIVLKFNPDHEIVKTIFEAIQHNVAELKTDNIVILNLSSVIKKEFNIRVTNAIKS